MQRHPRQTEEMHTAPQSLPNVARSCARTAVTRSNTLFGTRGGGASSLIGTCDAGDATVRILCRHTVSRARPR
jgi:hypothetical protein